jgi:hypothetical protein
MVGRLPDAIRDGVCAILVRKPKGRQCRII